MTTKRTTEKMISELIGALTDPIIACPGGWGADTPRWLKEQVTIERMLILKTGPEGMATDAEATIYLMSASFEAPLGHDWSEIYLYMATKEAQAHGTPVPADIRVEKITEYQQGELRRLKRWLYETRVKHREKTPRNKTPELAPAPEPFVVRQGQFDFGLQEVKS